MPEALAELLTRKGPVTKSTWNPETRTVEIVASSFADVRRYGYIERLSSRASDWDLSRIASAAGVPFLSGHNAFELDAKLGKVISAKVKRDGLHATVKLSETDAANRLVRDIETGIGCGISIGYAVARWSLDDSGDVQVRTATDIKLLEISAVSIAADPAAAVRNLNIPSEEEHEMPDNPAPREFNAEQRAAVVKMAGLTGAFLRRHAEVPEIEFRALVLDEKARQQGRHETSPMVDPTRSDGRLEGRREAVVDALMVRVNPSHKPANDSREFVGLTTVEIARQCLEQSGQRSYGTPSDIIARALHSTSDFPLILSDLLGKSLANSYQPAAAALKRVARQSTARDFRAKHHIALSEGAGLEKVNESGEFKRGSMKESSESYRLETYGKIFGITRQALVNDDLGAFVDIPGHLARTAAVFEAKTLAALLVSNPTMGDGISLFHATHKNLMPQVAFGIPALTAARLAMRTQTGMSGDLISVAPSFLIVGPQLETAAEQVLATIAAAKVSDVNPFAGKLELVVESRLPGLDWYLSASPNEVDGLEYSFLEGEEGPQIESRAGFDVDGLEVRVRLDFGAAFLDHRGWVKTPGA